MCTLLVPHEKKRPGVGRGASSGRSYGPAWVPSTELPGQHGSDSTPDPNGGVRISPRGRIAPGVDHTERTPIASAHGDTGHPGPSEDHTVNQDPRWQRSDPYPAPRLLEPAHQLVREPHSGLALVAVTPMYHDPHRPSGVDAIDVHEPFPALGVRRPHPGSRHPEFLGAGDEDAHIGARR